MNAILSKLSGISRYAYKEEEVVLWGDKVNPIKDEINQPSDTDILKAFNHHIIQGFDVKEHYNNMNDKNKFKDMIHNEKVNRAIEDVNKLHLINENISSFAYYAPDKRNKLRLTREKDKQGFSMQNIVSNTRHDNAYYAKKIKDITATINFKKQVG